MRVHTVIVAVALSATVTSCAGTTSSRHVTKTVGVSIQNRESQFYGTFNSDGGRSHLGRRRRAGIVQATIELVASLAGRDFQTRARPPDGHLSKQSDKFVIIGPWIRAREYARSLPEISSDRLFEVAPGAGLEPATR